MFSRGIVIVWRRVSRVSEFCGRVMWRCSWVIELVIIIVGSRGMSRIERKEVKGRFYSFCLDWEKESLLRVLLDE